MSTPWSDASPPSTVQEALLTWGLVRREGNQWVIGPHHTLDAIVCALEEEYDELVDRSDLGRWLRGEYIKKTRLRRVRSAWRASVLHAVAALGGATTLQQSELHALWLQEEHTARMDDPVAMHDLWRIIIRNAEAEVQQAHALRVYWARPQEADNHADKALTTLRGVADAWPRMAETLAAFHRPLIIDILAARTELATAPYGLLDTTEALVRMAWRVAEAHQPPEERHVLYSMGSVRLAVAYRYIASHGTGDSKASAPAQARDMLEEAWETYEDPEHHLIVAREMSLLAAETKGQRDVARWQKRLEDLLGTGRYSEELLILGYEALAQIARQAGNLDASLTALAQGWRYHQMLPQRPFVRYRTLQLLRAQLELARQHPRAERDFSWHSPSIYDALSEGRTSGYARIVDSLRDLIR